MKFAVISAIGKQHIVWDGKTLTFDHIPGEVGSTVKFPVLLKGDTAGDEVEIGTPQLDAVLAGTITSQERSVKVTVMKFKRKVRYRRKTGHRYPVTTVVFGKV